jgi:COMPASS component SPP1
LSKYCSDECGTNYMRAKIAFWADKGGDKDRLWESVKSAERREGVVQCVVANGNSGLGGEQPNGLVTVAVVANNGQRAGGGKTKTDRALDRLRAQLDDVVRTRETLMREMEPIVWREKVSTLAIQRAEGVEECGWDQRLCFGDEDIAEFGSGVVESYEAEAKAKDEAGEEAETEEADAEWWCKGKKKCERHAG